MSDKFTEHFLKIIEMCTVEEQDMFLLRINFLLEVEAEDKAARIIDVYARSLTLPISNEWSPEFKDYIKDMSIMLQVFNGDNCNFEVLQQHSITESLAFVQRLTQQVSKSDHRIYRIAGELIEMAVHIALCSAVSSNDRTLACSQELREVAKVWACHQNTEPQMSEELFKDLIRKRKLYFPIYSLTCVLYQHLTCVALKSKCIETFIEELTYDVNRMRQEECQDSDSEVEIDLSAAFLMLAELFEHNNFRLYRECILTAFSLHPTQETFEHVELVAQKCIYEPDVTSVPSSPSNDNNNEHCVSIMNGSGVYSDMHTSRDDNRDLLQPVAGVSQSVLDDLMGLINSVRWKMLNCSLEWSELKRLCTMYLSNKKTILKGKELTNLRIDYSKIMPKPNNKGTKRKRSKIADVNSDGESSKICTAKSEFQNHTPCRLPEDSVIVPKNIIRCASDHPALAMPGQNLAALNYTVRGEHFTDADSSVSPSVLQCSVVNSNSVPEPSRRHLAHSPLENNMQHSLSSESQFHFMPPECNVSLPLIHSTVVNRNSAPESFSGHLVTSPLEHSVHQALTSDHQYYFIAPECNNVTPPLVYSTVVNTTPEPSSGHMMHSTQHGVRHALTNDHQLYFIVPECNTPPTLLHGSVVNRNLASGPSSGNIMPSPLTQNVHHALTSERQFHFIAPECDVSPSLVHCSVVNSNSVAEPSSGCLASSAMEPDVTDAVLTLLDMCRAKQHNKLQNTIVPSKTVFVSTVENGSPATSVVLHSPLHSQNVVHDSQASMRLIGTFYPTGTSQPQ